MQSDCEIYVDPEEDEVFFGCLSEREKTISSKLVNGTGSSPRNECMLNEVLDGCSVLNVDEGNIENLSKNGQSGKVIEEILLENSTDSIQPHEEVRDSCQILSGNSSVELEHNYSTPMKHKIDKSILTTPKSVVKADKDGGFLKVLSEIALVKAEAEGEKQSADKREDEDKENKLASSLPEIKVTEATPEKPNVASPPKNISTELRRFRIIYASPQKEESKSWVENFETEKNYINKCLDLEIEEKRNKPIDLIDLNEGEESVEPEKYTKEEEEKKCEDVGTKINIKTTPANIRFSKDARKIVEVLKKTAEDTLNFTIPEIDVEEEENSFLSPESVPGLDDTIIPTNLPRSISKPTLKERPEVKTRTLEKERPKLTPVSSQSRLQPMRFFSERRLNNLNGGEVKSRCVKKLPLEEKKTTGEKPNGKVGEQIVVSSSKIPVFGTKNSKIPLTERVVKNLVGKTTPARVTPSGKTFKNPKFDHIESPINAYIHNKPTSLVCNVKPEIKKDCLAKVWKAQGPGNEKKFQGKPVAAAAAATLPNQESSTRLPFVEYRSGTPYKIEKKPESRLPRLAPTVMKLIGSHSPKVLRHEGRFFVNAARRGKSGENTTIVADPKEVSVVVSQTVQKSNTIK